MIIDWTDIETGDNRLAEVFKGRVDESPWSNWESNIPDISQLKDSVALDPALGGQFADIEQVKTSLEPLMKFIGDLAMLDFIRGTRETLGQVARTSGLLTNEFSAVKTILTSDSSTVIKGFDVAGVILDSPLFEMALNAIGAVPVVGWIVKIIYDISRTIADIVMKVRKEGRDKAKRAMAREQSIPIASLEQNPETDDLQTKAFFRFLSPAYFDPQQVIRPPYSTSATGEHGMFCAADVKEKVSDNKRLGWVIYGAEPSGGMGLVPGTSNITRSLYFPAGLSSAPGVSSKGCAGGSVRDVGTLYPTATNLSTGWWSQISKPGPSMYMVNPLSARNEWEIYMENLFALAQNIMKGWVCAPTGKAFTNKFYCIGSTKGMGACNNRRSNGSLLTIPSDFGRASHTVYYAYLCELFFGLIDPYNTKKGGLTRLPHLSNAGFDKPSSYYQNDIGSKYFRADYIDYDESVPSKSLMALDGRQRATLKSINCMYVNGRDPERFPAFTNSALKDLWEESVTALFQTEDWRKATFADIPEGEAKDAFYQKAKAAGINDVENYRYRGHMQLSGSADTVLGDPSPPAMPDINGAALKRISSQVLLQKKGKKSKKKSNNLPLLLAAGALGILMLKK